MKNEIAMAFALPTLTPQWIPKLLSRLNTPNVSYVTMSKLRHLNPKHVISKGKGYPPVLAYWILGKE
ncbi:hypothetical protein JHK85_022555 [Glycine max]|nr:hypothetical protein JHK85_022555 [Glycine max]